MSIYKLSTFDLECGETLRNVELAYTTYGTLNRDRSNVVLIHHALTGNCDVTEWWPSLVGNAKPFDPIEKFIICVNALGGCNGSTGPESIDPRTGERYAARFPTITIRDIARSELAVLEALGISSVETAIGGSMGGMVALELALLAPERVKQLIVIAAGVEHSAWRLAFSATVRHTVQSLAQKFGQRGLEEGLRIARQFAMISYRSSAEFEHRFARERMSPDPTHFYDEDNLFEVESYLHHQGDKILTRFSPYSYLTLTRAMELYDVCRARGGDPVQVLSRITAQTLIVGIDSDILYSEAELQQIAQLIPGAEYRTLQSIYGHDGFLVDQAKLAVLVDAFCKKEVESD